MKVNIKIGEKEYEYKVDDREAHDDSLISNGQKVMEIDVLGTTYKIIKHDKDDKIRIDGCDGYCDYTVKEIHIAEMEDYEWGNVDAHANRTIRHELVHAFLYESGLDIESWARNEELVDWMAIQIPKVANKYNELNI